MQSDDVVDFQSLATKLREQGIFASPAEFQGLLCGFVCGGLAHNLPRVYLLCSELLIDREVLNEQVQGLIQQHVHQLDSNLKQSDSLCFLFPEGDSVFQERLEALSNWTQAFLTGLAASEFNLNRLLESLDTLLQEMGQIAQAGHQYDGYADEVSFKVLQEHVGFGAQLFYQAALSQRS